MSHRQQVAHMPIDDAVTSKAVRRISARVTRSTSFILKACRIRPLNRTPSCAGESAKGLSKPVSRAFRTTRF